MRVIMNSHLLLLPRYVISVFNLGLSIPGDLV